MAPYSNLAKLCHSQIMSRVTPVVLSPQQIEQELLKLPGWSLKSQKLYAKYIFADFKSAFAFMAAVATKADQMDHHPEWFNVYNRLQIELITHDCNVAGGAVTSLDVELAQFMSHLALQMGAKN